MISSLKLSTLFYLRVPCGIVIVLFHLMPIIGLAQTTGTKLLIPQTVAIPGAPVSMFSMVSSDGLAPTGSISFMDGANNLHTQTVVPKSATNLLNYSSDGNHWMLSGAGDIAPAAAVSPDGSHDGFLVQYPGTGDTFFYQDVAPIDSLQPYIFSVWLRSTSGTINTSLSIQDQNAAVTARQVSISALWQRYTVIASLSYDAAFARVTIGGQGTLGPSVVGNSIQVWGGQLEKSLPGPYVPSQGTPIQSGLATNLLPYSVRGDYWSPSGDQIENDYTDINVPDVDVEGTYYTGNFAYQGDFADTYLGTSIGAQVGDPNYVFSIWLRTPAGQSPISTGIDLLSGGTLVAHSAILITGDWARFAIAGNLAGSSSVGVRVGGGNAFGPQAAPGSFDFWGAQVEQGTAVPGPYIETQGRARNAAVINLLPYSSSPNAWSMGGGGTLGPSIRPDPMGTMLAVNASYTAKQDTVLIETSSVTDFSKAYKLSVWLRSSGASFNTYIALLDQIGTVASVPVSLTPDWRRYSVTGYPSTASTTLKVGVGSILVGGQCPQGDGAVGSFDVFGAQLEPVTAGGYVPTSGAPAYGAVGIASFSISTLTPGIHPITASYAGDANSIASTSASIPVTILGVGTPIVQNITLTCLPNTVLVGQGFDCMAQFPSGVTGQVAFSINGSTWATVPISLSGTALASSSSSALQPGLYQITADYSGSRATATETTSLLVVSPGQPVPTPISPLPSATQNLVYGYFIPPTGYDGAGNITSYVDSVNGSGSFTYDNLNRLLAGSLTGGNDGSTSLAMGWTYDSFGNRLSQFGDPYSSSATYDANNWIVTDNQVPLGSAPTAGSSATNGLYDAAGNMVDDGLSYYAYDADGRLCATVNYKFSSVATGYIYDAVGQRVAKGNLTIPSGNHLACPSNFPNANFQVTTAYLKGPKELPMAEYTGSATTRTYIYTDTALLASQDSLGIHINLSDWLGSRRVQVSLAATIEGSFSNLPFGDGLISNGSDDANQHFTGKERDTESGLDYFGARYYGSNMGRFASPDNGIDQHVGDPQSWNLYTYVRDNPLRATDPTGMMACATGTGGTVELSNQSLCNSYNGRDGDDNGSGGNEAAQKENEAKRKAQQQTPAPTPNPNGSVPAPAPGKAPGWKPGNPLTPNEWVPGKGSNSPDGRPTRWNPKYPIPGGSQPNTSWDAPSGHWDNPDGKGTTTRWLPGGGRVDHDNNPLMNAFIRVTVWGIVQAIRFDQWVNTPCSCSQKPQGGPAAVPAPQ